MIVRPDEISASRAPSTSPLKHCDTKLTQLITLSSAVRRDEFQLDISAACSGEAACRGEISSLSEREPPEPRSFDRPSGIVAELAAEGVGLLHQRFARQDLHDLPVVLVVRHILRRLAADDDDGTDELVIL